MVVSAPAGSGKTVLLRSWISEAGLEGSAAWVPVGREERDPQRFWLSVLDALRQTTAGSGLVRELTAAPDLDGWAVVERLLKDLAPLEDRIWLVVDDVHHLGSAEALRQLELLLMRAPPPLRFVLATRHDLRLGLHRLRLEGELAEIRAGDLRFSLAEARELFAAAGVQLSEPELARLHERTEGWAAGLRLAALSLSGHPDPGRFAAEFSGSERTVAEYLLAEVLERQSEQVRRLLLRTSVLERVSGPLADALTGDSGGERVLQDLEEANAFVVALDAARAWFRYHRLFADLLQLELRRAAPGEVTGLHRVAAQWFAERWFAVEAIRHAQAAQDWGRAARLLAEHWPGLHLDGQAAVIHELLAGFPHEARAADAELAAVAAGDELAQGSLEAAERYLALAERAPVPDGGRGRRGYWPGSSGCCWPASAATPRRRPRRRSGCGPSPETAQPGLGEELRALALISLGITEYWAAGPAEAERHLEQGRILAHRIGRPFLEVSGLAYQSAAEGYRSFARAEEYSMSAIELAERHGWTDEPATGIAYLFHGAVLAWQGRLEEAGLGSSAPSACSSRSRARGGAGGAVHRGVLELGRDAGARWPLSRPPAAGRRPRHAAIPPPGGARVASAALLPLGERNVPSRPSPGWRPGQRGDLYRRRGAPAARHDPRAALAALARSSPAPRRWRRQPGSLWLSCGSDRPGGARRRGRRPIRPWSVRWTGRARRRAGVFLWRPVPGLLERHARGCARHAALVSETLTLLTPEPGFPGPVPRGHAGPKEVRRSGEPPVTRGLGHRSPGLIEPLSRSEIGCCVPADDLSAPSRPELSVSVTTVRTHISHLFVKLGAHRRTEAVARARDLGLLAPSPMRRAGQPRATVSCPGPRCLA